MDLSRSSQGLPPTSNIVPKDAIASLLLANYRYFEGPTETDGIRLVFDERRNDMVDAAISRLKNRRIMIAKLHRRLR